MLSLAHKQRHPDSSSPAKNRAPSFIQQTLSSPGEPLNTATREAMENHLGFDFSHVRVHHDARAAASAESLQARAYTATPNLVFGEGQYRPGTPAGDRLIAHELTHIAQQQSYMDETFLPVSSPGDAAEMEASAAASAWNTGHRASVSHHTGPAIHRDRKHGKKASQSSSKSKVFIHEGFTGR